MGSSGKKQLNPSKDNVKIALKIRIMRLDVGQDLVRFRTSPPKFKIVNKINTFVRFSRPEKSLLLTSAANKFNYVQTWFLRFTSVLFRMFSVTNSAFFNQGNLRLNE